METKNYYYTKEGLQEEKLSCEYSYSDEKESIKVNLEGLPEFAKKMAKDALKIMKKRRQEQIEERERVHSSADRSVIRSNKCRLFY